MQKKRASEWFLALAVNLFFKSRLFGGIGFMVARAPGFQLYPMAGKQTADPAYALVGYLELLVQKPLGVFEPGDLTLFHLPGEGLPSLGANTLAFTARLSELAKRLQPPLR
jgi:hypothetical protein